MRKIITAITAGILCYGCSDQESTPASPPQQQTVSTADAAPADPPPGSYQITCSDISLRGDTLSATCEKLNGSTQETTLGTCVSTLPDNGDIGNIDGNLVCIPDLHEADPDLAFPQSETAINEWIYGDDDQSIYRHAWGIWAGVTDTAGTVDGRKVRAFETWSTLGNIKFRIGAGPTVKGKLDLAPPRQFGNTDVQSAPGGLKVQADGDGDTGIAVSVAYNPPAARHAIDNKLFLQSTLDRYLANGYTEIPNFPVNAITVKPVYKIIPKEVPDGIYTFPGWPGTPDPAKKFPEDKWGACVYVDINGSGAGGSSIDKGCQGRTAQNTFFLNNFIHQKIDARDAQYLSSQLNLTVNEGDYAILVGMHVATREIKRWTWQSFWWSASPDAPLPPSSKAIARHRPDQYLDEAAGHYAMTVSYYMVDPPQPVNGGQNAGQSVIGYNPHLEAGFGRDTFQVFRKINDKVENQYGVQTNCMTCHGLAYYDPEVDYSKKNKKTAANRQKPYGPDFYLSRDDEKFEGKLQLDFAWSILGALELDGQDSAQ